jgi:hypothetical protein
MKKKNGKKMVQAIMNANSAEAAVGSSSITRTRMTSGGMGKLTSSASAESKPGLTKKQSERLEEIKGMRRHEVIEALRPKTRPENFHEILAWSTDLLKKYLAYAEIGPDALAPIPPEGQKKEAIGYMPAGDAIAAKVDAMVSLLEKELLGNDAPREEHSFDRSMTMSIRATATAGPVTHLVVDMFVKALRAGKAKVSVDKFILTRTG